MALWKIFFLKAGRTCINQVAGPHLISLGSFKKWVATEKAD